MMEQMTLIPARSDTACGTAASRVRGARRVAVWAVALAASVSAPLAASAPATLASQTPGHHETRRMPPTEVLAGPAFGLKGGPTLADAYFFDQFTSAAVVRTVLGGFATFPISDRGSVQIEGLYVEKGFSTTGLHQEGSTVRAAYLDFPILLRFRLSPRPARVRPLVMAGAYWGHEVVCQVTGGVARLEESERCDGRYRLRGLADVGITFGGGVEVSVAEDWFMLAETRYHLGLRNLHWDPSPDGASARNWSMLGGVGLRLGR